MTASPVLLDDELSYHSAFLVTRLRAIELVGAGLGGRERDRCALARLRHALDLPSVQAVHGKVVRLRAGVTQNNLSSGARLHGHRSGVVLEFSTLDCHS